MSRWHQLTFWLGRPYEHSGLALAAVLPRAIPAVRAALQRVEAAIDLIRERDPRRFDRVTRDLRRVFVTGTAIDAEYIDNLQMCIISGEVALAPSTTPEQLALLLVHEATHARLAHAGFAYAPERRARLERVCVKAELAFAERLPEPERSWYVAHLRARLAAPGPDYSDAALVARQVDRFREWGMPPWFIRWLERRQKAVAGRRRQARSREIDPRAG